MFTKNNSVKDLRKNGKRSNRFSQQGKQANQKMKPYLVFQYLMKYSDEDHVVTASDIVAYLQEVVKRQGTVPRLWQVD